MYATAAFDFTQGDNAYLMSGYAFMRAFFLIFLFPQIIERGRKWYVSRGKTGSRKPDQPVASDIPTSPSQLEVPISSQAEEEPVITKPTNDEDASHFDLFFLRWSLMVDGILTMGAAFATKGWHIYLGELG